MARDYRKLRVFHLADTLAVRVYQASRGLPVAEPFGLQSQLRRAAVSAAANIVEGSAPSTTRDFVRCLNTSAGAAAEARYVIDLWGERFGLAASG